MTMGNRGSTVKQMAARQGRHGTQQALRERGTQATGHVHKALHLPNGRNDATLLRTAIDEVLAQEVSHNEHLANAVRVRYEELAGLYGSSPRRASARDQRTGLEPLIPLRVMGRPLNSARTPDPRELIWVYGADKLGRALHEYTMDTLKSMADRIQQQYPGIKPTNRASRKSLVDYIVAHTAKDIGDWNPSMLPPDLRP
jgi:hypothetical protein